MNKRYKLYLAGGITLWKNYFKDKYSKYFNNKLDLFEPGTLNVPDDHREISKDVAKRDLEEIDKADALLVYMKHYKTLDGSPDGTDSTWECGYATGHGKPVIVIIEDEEHIDYYATQWMLSYHIDAVLTTDPRVAEIIKEHHKFEQASVLVASGIEEFEERIREYLNKLLNG